MFLDKNKSKPQYFMKKAMFKQGAPNLLETYNFLIFSCPHKYGITMGKSKYVIKVIIF